jgi:protein tyrosine/serine phosphatase
MTRDIGWRLTPLLGALLLALAPAAAADAAAARAPIDRFNVVDDLLFRGAQPDVEGFRYLRSIGIRTIVNLREEKDAVRLREQQTVESLGMRYINLPVKDGNFFTRSRRIPEETVRAFLQLFDAAEAGPVFVHCRRGADRTGALVAMYRIARHGWKPARAYAEARELGMRSWYHGLKKQIEEFRAESVQRSRS